MQRLIAAAALALASTTIVAADLGVSLGGNYYINAAPAGWYTYDADPQKYRADATIFITHRRLQIAVQPYMQGSTTPDLAGLYAGAGVVMGPATLSVFHHSCHNLDRGANWIPPCQYNGVRLRVDIGHTFEPLW